MTLCPEKLRLRTGAQLVTDLLAAWSLGPVFHVPGEGVLEILDALATRQPGVRLVTARHEAGAAFMASGAARASGRPAVCLVARAPGALNTCLALHTAMTDAVPLLMIVGQAPMAHFEREAFLDTGFHQVFAPLCKSVALATDPARLPELMARALHAATTGRHGPAVLILPEDVARAETDAVPIPPPAPVHPAPGDGPMAAVAAHLRASRRPIMVVGGSDWDGAACDQLRSVAGRLGLPVATTYRRRDLFDNADPGYAGELGLGADPALVRRVGESDLVLALGLRLGELNTVGEGFHGFTLLDTPRPQQVLVHVHADAAELNRVFAATVAVQSTPGAFISALARLGLEPRPEWAAWREAAQADVDAREKATICPGPVDLPAIFRWLRARLPDDAGVTVGAGAYALWAQRCFPHRRLRTLIGPKSGAMGYGLPAAIGAACACPERRFVALAGDGCFTMNAEELATAVQERLPVTTIVFNNAAYGAIGLTQRRSFGRTVGTALARLDFAAFARSFGAHGERVDTTEAFAPAFERAVAADGPAVIDVVVPPEATRPP